MTIADLFQFLLYAATVIVLVKPLGWYITKVFNGEPFFLRRPVEKIEFLLYRAAGVKTTVEQHWIRYAGSFLLFHFIGFLFLYTILRLQAYLPLNPSNLPNVSADLSLNTAISFLTNTNWQNYAGEKTLSYFSQMVGLTVQNFFSAASGIAVAVALIRGFSRQERQTIGNFWVDMTRAILYILLPLSAIFAIFLIWQGVPQNFSANIEISTLEHQTQIIPQGPVASQEAIKIVGTNGGGFFNANSAHPYENPTPLTNFFQMVMMVVIGTALTNVFGRMIGDQRQGWAIFTAMGILLVMGMAAIYYFENQPNPLLTKALNELNIVTEGGNMEGKEVRFGLFNSSLFAALTTATSTGAVNSLHSSFMPLSGGLMILNMVLGEIIIGGAGSGLYGMLLFVILTSFIAGLMVGRTPEYNGNKLQSREIKMAMLATFITPLIILGLTSIAANDPIAVSSVTNPGPHGFSEILYLYTSSAANNGSAFAGINGNTLFYNITGAIAMLLGRLMVVIPVLAIAGSLASKRFSPITNGSLPTHNLTFIILLIAVILIFGILTFLPVLALGPLAEHLSLIKGLS